MEKTAVILAGGGGTRFWPLSRQNKPKQFINISGNDIMINDTIARCETIISGENTFIVTNKIQAEMLETLLTDKVPKTNVLREPVPKNTSACILFASLYLRKKLGDVIMAVLPSDHYISDLTKFKYILNKAFNIAAETDNLVTIGIKPTFAATGYGYINYDSSSKYGDNVYEVIEFEEKPDFEKAKKYISSGNYLWNSGMFVWKASTIIDSFQRFLPRLYKSLMQAYEYLGTEKEQEVINKIYPSLQNVSIDYGVMERSDNVVVIPADFGWNDVGSWDSLGSIFPPDENGNIIKANHVGIDTKNTIIYSENRLIATIGIEELIIADTNDALLICPKSKAQDVKKLVDLLKDRAMDKYL